MPYYPEQPLQPESVLPVVSEAVYSQQQTSLHIRPDRVQEQAERSLTRRDDILARWVEKNAAAHWPLGEASIGQFAITQTALVYDLLLRQSVANAGGSICLDQIPGPQYQQDILATSGPPLPVLRSGPRLQDAVDRSRASGFENICEITDSTNHFVGRLIAESPGAPDEHHRAAGQQLAGFTYSLLHEYVSLARQPRR